MFHLKNCLHTFHRPRGRRRVGLFKCSLRLVSTLFNLGFCDVESGHRTFFASTWVSSVTPDGVSLYYVPSGGSWKPLGSRLEANSRTNGDYFEAQLPATRQMTRFYGFKISWCLGVKICKISRLQDFRISIFQDFKISRFQDFKISRFRYLKIWELQDFEISSFQDFNILGFQDFKISGFQHLRRPGSYGTWRSGG